jgi:hypothetical protein
VDLARCAPEITNNANISTQPATRRGPQPRTALVQQSEDVLVDTRGNIYVDDKQWGLWIVRYTGPDQPAPTDR